MKGPCLCGDTECPWCGPLQGGPTPPESDVEFTSEDESGEFPTASEDPFAEFYSAAIPFFSINDLTESGASKSTGAEIECEIRDGGEPWFRFKGEDWAELQSLSPSDAKIIVQILLGLVNTDDRMFSITQVSIANRPKSGGTDVGRH